MTYVILAPKYGILQGPVDASLQLHPCFHGRAFKDFVKSLPSDETDDDFACFDACPMPPVPPAAPVPPTAAVPPAAPVAAAVPQAFVPVPVAPGPVVAVPEAVIPVPPAPVPTIAAPQAVVPLLAAPGPTAAAPLAVAHEDPLFLPESSPTPEPDVNTFMSFLAWWLEVDTECKKIEEEYSFYLKALDIDRAAQALIEFLIAIHNGQQNLSRQRRAALDVKIQPGSSISGLFIHNTLTFHV